MSLRGRKYLKSTKPMAGIFYFRLIFIIGRSSQGWPYFCFQIPLTGLENVALLPSRVSGVRMVSTLHSPLICTESAERQGRDRSYNFVSSRVGTTAVKPRA